MPAARAQGPKCTSPGVQVTPRPSAARWSPVAALAKGGEQATEVPGTGLRVARQRVLFAPVTDTLASRPSLSNTLSANVAPDQPEPRSRPSPAAQTVLLRIDAPLDAGAGARFGLRPRSGPR